MTYPDHAVLGRARWVPIYFLFAGGMINYMDRSAVSVVAPFLMRDLHLDPAQLGVVFSSFFAGYALFNFVGGYASDKLGPKRIFTLAMTVWSAFCGFTALASGFTSLLVLRVIFGFGEGPFSSAANRMVCNWFPRSQSATAVGLANAGTPIGGALAGPVAGWLALHYGWRISFVVLASIGFVWTILWSLTVTDHPPDRRPQHEIEPPPSLCELPPLAPGARSSVLRFYLKQPAVLATGAAFFGYSYILYFFLTWFPSYLTISRHLNIRDMAFVSTIPWILGTVGLLASGFSCDVISRLIGDALRARVLVLAVCLSVAAICVTIAGLIPSLTWSVAFMGITILFNYLTGAAYWAIIQELVDTKNVGAVGGFVHLIANCAGIVGPAVTGFIVQLTGVFSSSFVFAGCIALVGAVLVAILVPRSAHRVALSETRSSGA
jgi:ACS family hexuronate transporter-like MFS transporter